jgi:hypothetical protein
MTRMMYPGSMVVCAHEAKKSLTEAKPLLLPAIAQKF